MAQPQDNFLLLRALAALAVILGHCYALKAGAFAQDPIARLGLGPGVYLGALAVDAFFFISGFLVTGSWFRQGTTGRFVLARAVRVLPAYWVLLLLTVCVLGPWASQWRAPAYLASPQTWDYLLGNLLYAHRWHLPGVFEELPYAGVVNGSLWSLRVEMLAYLALAMAGIAGLLRHASVYLLSTLLALLALHQWAPVLGSGDYLWPLTMFGLGSMAWVFRDRLPLGTPLLLALVLACVFAVGSAWFRGLLALALGYGCLWLAYVPRLLWPYNRVGDYSYGLYLYGFPVQQSLVWIFQLTSIWTQFLAAAAITLVLAAASWHGIEQPCLRALRRWRAAQPAPARARPQPSPSKAMPTVE